MLGGLFAYDLVAGFEDLPALRRDQRCPDFCFYLAETLLVLDHQRGTARLQASVFSEQASEAQRLQQRLEQLQAELQQTPQPIPHQTLENMQLSCNQSDEEYGAVVSGLQEAIRQGEIFGGAVAPLLPALPGAAGGLPDLERQQPQPVHVLHAG